MTHGTPSSVPRLARVWLQMATTTIPTTAIRPILISVRLAGGATSPLLRRPESRSQRDRPSPATTTAIAIQLIVGSIVPHIRLYRTCSLLLKPVRFG